MLLVGFIYELRRPIKSLQVVLPSFHCNASKQIAEIYGDE